MNRKKVIVITCVVLAIVAITAAIVAPDFLQPPQTYLRDKTGSQMALSPQPGNAKSAKKIQPGTYEAYSETTFTKSADNRRILFFHATWCPQCQQLDKEILGNKVPGGITILKVDYDTSHELRVKYGVTLQTTIVEVDGSGEKIKSVVMYDEPTFANLAAKLSL